MPGNRPVALGRRGDRYLSSARSRPCILFVLPARVRIRLGRQRVDIVVDPLQDFAQDVAQALALALEVTGHSLHLVGEPAPCLLEALDLPSEALLRLCGDLRCQALGIVGQQPGLGIGLRDDPSGLGLRVGLGLVDELLGKQQRPLQGVVGDRRLDPLGLGLGLPLEFGLQLGDALGRLSEPLSVLAELLLEPFGLDRSFLEVFVDIVPVVTLERLTELDGAKGVEGRLDRKSVV